MSSQRKSDKPDEGAKLFAVADPIKVNLHTRRIVEAPIKAVINRTESPRLQVNFGNDETALIRSWQVIEKLY
jgi:hypothetical protein